MCAASAAVRSLLRRARAAGARRGGVLLLLRFVERVFEVVTGKYVTLDERLSESTGLTGEHAGSPAAPVALFLTTAADSAGFVSAGPRGAEPQGPAIWQNGSGDHPEDLLEAGLAHADLAQTVVAERATSPA